jgi:hypothetical protein
MAGGVICDIPLVQIACHHPDWIRRACLADLHDRGANRTAIDDGRGHRFIRCCDPAVRHDREAVAPGNAHPQAEDEYIGDRDAKGGRGHDRNADTDANVNPWPDGHANADTSADRHANPDTSADRYANTDTSADPHTDAGSNAHANTSADANANPGSNPNAGSDANANAGTDAAPHRDQLRRLTAPLRLA